MGYHAFARTFDGISHKLTSSAHVTFGNHSMEVVALWDTGATLSCISSEVVSALHLPPVGRCKAQTPTGSGIRNTYYIDILLPDDVKFPGQIVMDSEIGKQKIGMLIGMDIISKGDFAVSNFDGNTVFTFRYPSNSEINFVKEFMEQNK